MCWTALASNPDRTCNPFIASNANTALQIVIGLLFTFWTVLSIAMASKTNESQRTENTTSVVGNALAEEVEGEAKACSPEEEKEMIFPVTVPTIIF